MLSWRIGAVKITCIVEQDELLRVHRFLKGGDQAKMDAVAWIKPPFVDEAGRLNFSVQAFVVETPARRILVDTCMGNHKPRLGHGAMLSTDFLQRFEAAGFARDSIDTVVCTHLHYDHVGWNTQLRDGRWVPTFPQARYLMGRDEFDHARADAEADHAAVFDDSVRPVFDAGLVDLVATDHRVCEEVSFTPTPGHTMGHVSVRIVSEGAEALITGDMAHHPVQMAFPDWHVKSDHDEALSNATRRSVFADAADRGVLLIGSHFAAPTAGRVARDGEVFRFEA